MNANKFKLKSHPDKLLYDHLKCVGEYSKKEILSKDLNLHVIEKEQLADISYLIGISHDIGKATEEFQRYICSEDKNSHTEHAPVSSIFALRLIKEYCKNEKIKELFYHIGYLCVKKHHSRLTNFLFENVNKFKIRDQIIQLRANEELREIYSALLINYNYLNFDEIISEIDEKDIENDNSKEINNCLRNINEEEIIEYYLISEFLYSVLIDFDKKDAAGIIKMNVKNAELNSKIVDEYLELKRKIEPEKFSTKKEINKIKNEFYNEIVRSSKFSKDKKIYTITAPTGIGKTLSSISLAMRIREEVSQKYKILYILPYTTVIDQNYEVVMEVLKNRFDDFEENKSNYLLKHHYLSTEDYKSNQMTKDNYLDYLLLIKSWDSNIVVSTYIQLLKSIIGSHRYFLNKLHNIVNSIIILDEVQFIENEYWKLVNMVFKVFTNVFNTYLILMTATQPRIFSKTDAIELSDDRFQSIPLISNKRRYIYSDEIKDVDDFIIEIKDEIKRKEYNRIIIVLNTKGSAKQVFKGLDEIKNKYELIFLSRDLAPKDIKSRIEEIEKFSERDRYLIITTQLIEAGVDISSDILFRDIAIIPSIIQSGGRCNRFNEINQGIVKIVNLKDKKNKNLLSKYVYDSKYINISREILRNSEEIREKEIIDEFFEKIEEDKNSDYIFEKLTKLNFSEVDENLQLIKKEWKTIPVFFTLNEEAESLLKEYEELLRSIRKQDNKFKVIGEIKKKRTKMEEYFIEIKEKEMNKLYEKGIIKQIGKIFFIPKELISNVYDETGYISNSEEDDCEGVII